MAVKSRDNLFDKPLKMLDLLRNAKWENSFLSKIALFTHSLKKVIPTFKEILSVSKTKNWCLLQNIIPTFLLKTFEFISFIIKGRDNKKVVITILVFRHSRRVCRCSDCLGNLFGTHIECCNRKKLILFGFPYIMD